MSFEVALKYRKVLAAGALSLLLTGATACGGDDDPSAEVETAEIETIAQEFYGEVTSTCTAKEWPLETREYSAEQTTRPKNEKEIEDFAKDLGPDMSSVACNNALASTLTKLLSAGLVELDDIPNITQEVTIAVGCDTQDGCLPIFRVDSASWSKTTPEPKE